MLAENADLNQRHALVITLFFIRILLMASNADSVDRRQRIAMSWSGLLWFTSIGLHKTTLRNLAHHVIGSLFVFARANVEVPRHCTEEPCEHSFGIMRRYNREFTIRDFVQLKDKCDKFAEAAFRSHVQIGGRTAKGYLQGLTGFISSSGADPQQPSAIRNKSDGITLGDEDLAASQLFDFIGPIINETTSCMGAIFDAFRVHQRSRSPFAVNYSTVNDLRALAASYLEGQVESPQKDTDTDEKERDNEDDDLLMNSLSERVKRVLMMGDDADPDDVIAVEDVDLSSCSPHAEEEGHHTISVWNGVN